MSLSDQVRDERNNQRYYDTFAATYDNQRHDGYHRWLDARTIELLSPYVAGRDVLEVGCGTGLLLHGVSQLARRAFGVDLSDGMLARARQRGLEVVQGSATELPFADASFDVAYSFKVLSHVPDLEKAFAEVARVVRPGGVALLELYNTRSLRYAIRRLRPAFSVGAGTDEKDVFTRFYSEAELVRRLPPTLTLRQTHGFRVATVMPGAFRVPGFGPLWARAEDALSASPLHKLAGFLVLVLDRRET